MQTIDTLEERNADVLPIFSYEIFRRYFFIAAMKFLSEDLTGRGY
jgi:hypothetical protein